MNYPELTQKKFLIDKHRPLPADLVRNLDEWFRVELTYTSNAIEGNTLTRQETAVVLEKGITVAGKSLVEHLEATNHAEALDFVKALAQNSSYQISEKDVLAIHALILKGINDKNAGGYRSVAVRIAGSRVVMPNPIKVPELMDKFINWLQTKHDLHPVDFAAQAHYQLVTIHPFVDGNGRTARLLMNLILWQNGYPPALIRKEDRLAYINSLEHAQMGGSLEPYQQIIMQAVERTLDIYLKAIKDSEI